MKFPKLVRNATIPIHVVVEAVEPNSFNERETLLEADFLCNYQDAAQVKYSSDKQSTPVTGVVFIDGDICPEVPTISIGHIVIFGAVRNIKKGTKARNPDGTVNYTRLDVI